MMFRRVRGMGSQANAAAGGFASRVDGQSTEVAARAAQMISVAVRLMRIPTAVVGSLPVPFVLMTLVLGVLADGAVAFVILAFGIVMLAVSVAFWARRARVLAAVREPDQLATELAIMISLTDKVEETRGALSQIAGGEGWRLLTRLRGVWKGATMTGRWIEGVGDLPRAKYFGPPKIGTSVTLTVAALWLVPISIVVALFSLVGTIAGSI
ncbi:hypothetical protein [Aeromicrobium stalagmiti]|uniref:hypothetical protein n=1 Tax=Aeromicrobium stalagmiti TaxID=2738988 RepID=UPI001569E27C|nr:hypothetical protein [Aeromicrobium stalagmiti]NRQ49434.1 hypothetical protein [Aeromicrobium stalagmiti]